MNFLEALQNRTGKISVVGLGYVGLPLAVEFAGKYHVTGFDMNERKLEKYRAGIDVTNEVGNERLSAASIEFTSDETKLKECRFHVVAVPTPVNYDKTPDLAPVIAASELVGRNLSKGAVVVFESTVYPGTTEEICVPILEQLSGLKLGTDFKVGYSPERINPGDKVNTLPTIIKIVSGSDPEALRIISAVYSSIIHAGVFEAECIKVAEAAKVIENAQRDINIAFMNELSLVFDRMNIRTKSVLEAAGTKWNFLNFSPGLVGGHCIGVDPYYFTYKAELLGYHSQIILAGRKINDEMGKHVADSTIKKMIQAAIPVNSARVALLGLTFKENVSDVRNTKVIDIVKELAEFFIEVHVYDPEADAEEVKEIFSLELLPENQLNNFDAVIIAVPHASMKHLFTVEELDPMFRNPEKKVVIDIKSVLSKEEFETAGYHYWAL
ncbi:nucleotide sugar dehydrogenase [Alkalicoccus daliensis]|uniref:UDP-N-acetyl-D-galactosamine dehydrogenase n=1 Tax=Alkalicoccus daliensis TaxID=745820 RepID=A0A1H0GJV7_9BACI|nr:nucleotide sugar dehydrogenase [Alkalicoccus daliensis]SDO07134.1 UDP-N-acetyl-D-galactosamine dehydrogenase [Alkalicoccus daliensis]